MTRSFRSRGPLFRCHEQSKEWPRHEIPVFICWSGIALEPGLKRPAKAIEPAQNLLDSEETNVWQKSMSWSREPRVTAWPCASNLQYSQLVIGWSNWKLVPPPSKNRLRSCSCKNRETPGCSRLSSLWKTLQWDFLPKRFFAKDS